MKRIIFWTEVLSVAIYISLVQGQANPNYVYYNPNLDVYRKPEVHSLAKAIAAQNELAMTKLAHFGMLDSSRSHDIPTRDSANFALSKMMEEASKVSSNLHEEKIVKPQKMQKAAKNTKETQRMETKTKPAERKSKSVPAANSKSNSKSVPLVLKTIDAKPMLTLSKNLLRAKLGSGPVKVDSVPILTRGAAAKSVSDADKLKLKTTKAKPQLRIPSEVLRRRLKSRKSPLPNVNAKMVGAKNEINTKKLKFMEVNPAIELQSDVYRLRLNGKDMPKERVLVKKANVEKNDVVKRLEKAKVKQENVIQRDSNLHIRKLKEGNFKERTQTQKAINSELLKLPIKTTDSKTVKVSEQDKFVVKMVNKPVSKASNVREPKTAAKAQFKVSKKIVKTGAPAAATLMLSDQVYKQKINNEQISANIWTNTKPVAQFTMPVSAKTADSNSPSLTSSKTKRTSKKQRKLMRRDRKRKMSFENNRIKELGKSAFRYELPLDRIVTTTSNGTCPRHWANQATFCMKKTEHPEKFRNAVIACLLADKTSTGPGSRLITVGKLRKLLKVPNFVVTFANHAYRINAFKDYDGYWKEFPSGRIIDFSAYRDFVLSWGKQGDTLVWMSRWNSLRVVRQHEHHYKGICYRERIGATQCQQPTLECSDHGDCVSGSCSCDSGYSGSYCQTAVSGGRSALTSMLSPPPTRGLCNVDCGPGGGCDPLTGQCECVTGTAKNDRGACECISSQVSGRCYVAGPKGVDYTTASKYCITRGLRMVEIHDEEDQKALETIVQGASNVWLGADNLGPEGEGFRWHSGIRVSTGELGGWSADLEANQEGCLAMSGVIGHTWMTMDCNQSQCCGNMNIETICRVY